MGAKLAGAPRRAARSPCNRFRALRFVALQQEVGALQLALRISGYNRRNLLRPRLERTTPGASLGDHAYVCGLVLVSVVLRCPLFPECGSRFVSAPRVLGFLRRR